MPVTLDPIAVVVGGFVPVGLARERRRDLLEVEEAIGVRLTENFAMDPAASVSGFYFSHPEARYFSVGRIGRDQVESYAGRKGMTVDEVERWLAPNLG